MISIFILCMGLQETNQQNKQHKQNKRMKSHDLGRIVQNDNLTLNNKFQDS